MVDEIEIKNVGNNGVASEATLQALLKAIEQLAKRSGADPKAAQAKTQDLLNRANTSGIKIITANSDALTDNTKAVDESTSAFKKSVNFLSGMFMNSIGMAFGSIKGLALAFNSGTNRLSDFVSQIPIFGEYLGKLTEYLDDTFAQYQSLAMSGASFGQSLTDIRKTAAQTGMSLGDFGNFVRNNSDKLAAMSSNVTNGAKALARLNKALGGQREELLGMGFTFEQVNEQLLNYAYMTRSRGQIENRDAVEVAARSADYAKSLATLSKLTGEDIQALQDKQVAQNNDLALQMKLTKMLPFQQDRMNKLMLEAQAAGPVAVARMKEIIMGFPPMTRETQLFAATMGESEAALNKSFQAAMSVAKEDEKYTAIQRRNQAEMLSGMLEGATNLEDVMAAGSLAGEGIGKELLDMLQASGVDLTKYIGKSGKVLTAAIEADIATAEAESAARDKSAGTMATFMDTLARVRAAFEIGVISPILEALTPILNDLTEKFKEVVESEGFNKALDYVKAKLQILKLNIESFLEAFKKDPWAAMTDALNSLLDPVAIAFSNLITKMEKTFVNSLLARVILGIDRQDVATGAALSTDPATATDAKNFGEILKRALGPYPDLTGPQQASLSKALPTVVNTLTDTQKALVQQSLDNQGWITSLGSDQARLKVFLNELTNKVSADEASQAEMDLLKSFYRSLDASGLITGKGPAPRSNSFANGTNGFQNFGKGSLAMLHGHEAVIPMNSDVGKMLSGKSDTSTSLHESISNTIATSNQGTSESINQLNNTMMQMLSILNQTKDLNAKIEKNTKYSGSDLSRGSISRMSQ